MKNYTYLKKAIMTGILRVTKYNIFTNLNNFREFTVLDDLYAEYFGFTENEVDKLIRNHKLNKNEIKE